ECTLELVQEAKADRKESPQLSVLFLSFDQDRYLRVCIFPELEEILIGVTCLRRVTLEGGGACQSEVRQRIEHRSDSLAPVIQDVLKLICRFSALPFPQVSLPQEVAVMNTRGVGAFIAANVVEYPDCLSGITTHDFDGRLNQRHERLINHPVFRILSDPLVNQGLGPFDLLTQGKGDTHVKKGDRTLRRARNVGEPFKRFSRCSPIPSAPQSPLRLVYRKYLLKNSRLRIQASLAEASSYRGVVSLWKPCCLPSYI